MEGKYGMAFQRTWRDKFKFEAIILIGFYIFARAAISREALVTHSSSYKKTLSWHIKSEA